MINYTDDIFTIMLICGIIYHKRNNPSNEKLYSFIAKIKLINQNRTFDGKINRVLF